MSVNESAAELIGDAIVFEYLKSRGLARTAEVYALESRRKFPALSDADELSTQLWVNFRQQLGVNKFIRDQADEGSSQQAKSSPSISTLEYLVQHSIRKFNDTRAGVDSASKPAATQGTADDDSQTAADDESEASTAATESKAATQKKKKKKTRKYQSPTPGATRSPGINHNVQFHSLGKPLYRKSRQKTHSRNDSDSEFPNLSKESWMPMELRMKMLKRDMMLAQQKQKDMNDWEYRKKKKAYKTDHHARMKTLQKYTKRSSLSRNMCALCEHEFLELPFGVSYKAIMDLRRVWGVKVVPESRYLKFSLMPHCYETVKVCVFCSQFFGLDFFDGARDKAVGV